MMHEALDSPTVRPEAMAGHLVFSTLLVVSLWWAYSRPPIEAAVLVLIVAALTFLLTVPYLLWCNLFVLVALFAGSRRVRARSTRHLIACVVMTTLVYVAFAARFYPTYREVMSLREQYQPVSLAERLGYETRNTQSAMFDSRAAFHPLTDPDLHLPEPISLELSRIEQKLRDADATQYRRMRSLQSLDRVHNGFVDEFARAQGFGFVRTRALPARRAFIEIPELPDLPEPPAVYSETTESPGQLLTVAEGPPQELPVQSGAPDEIVLRDVHEAGAADFANPAGFGYVVPGIRMIGFQPHGFRTSPELPTSDDGSSRWQIIGVELVSLLKHAQPEVYLSKNLPRMDELIDAPTRPLDSFETQSLEKLRAGGEIVVERQRDELRMLGSLRAARQCTECHSVSRGDLLGAFTYRLRREGAARPQPAQPAKPVL
jgi:hypothetical protein